MSHNFSYQKNITSRASISLGTAKYSILVLTGHCSEDGHRPQGIRSLINKTHIHYCTTNYYHCCVQLAANFLNESEICSFILAYKRAYYVPVAYSSLSIKQLEIISQTRFMNDSEVKLVISRTPQCFLCYQRYLKLIFK